MMIIKISKLVLIGRPCFRFSQQEYKKSYLDSKDLDRSLKSFALKLNLEPRSTRKQQNIPINHIIEPKTTISTKSSTSTDFIQKLATQTQSLKERILAGKTRQFKEVNEHYAQLSRPASVYAINELERKNIKNQREIAEIMELMASEESQDHASPHPDWVQEQNELWDYSMSKISQAMNAQSHGFKYIPQEKSKARNIVEWRKWNKVFEPFSRQPNESFPYIPYPGSEKGIFPEDDPESYLAWFRRTHSQEVIQGLDEIASQFQGRQNQENELEQAQKEIKTSEIYTYANEALQPCTNTQLLNNDLEENLTDFQGSNVLRSHKEEDEIEPLPEYLPIDPDELFDEMERWIKFRSIQAAIQLSKGLQDLQQEQKYNQQEQFEHTLTSLYPYYSTLPEFIRNHSQVKTAYKALEFEKPTLSIQQKEQALNFTCLSALELDELSDQVLTQLAETRRHHPTLEDEKKMIHDAETTPFDAVLTHLENEDYQDKKPIYPDLISAPGEIAYPFPERMKYEQEDLTPVDYYQNDDGFWNDYIKNKYEKYYKNHRFATRKYFKH